MANHTEGANGVARLGEEAEWRREAEEFLEERNYTTELPKLYREDVVYELVSHLHRLVMGGGPRDRIATIIVELNNDVNRLRGQQDNALRALSLILPMAKGYAAQHPVGSNQRMIQIAEDVLRETQRRDTPRGNSSEGEKGEKSDG